MSNDFDERQARAAIARHVLEEFDNLPFHDSEMAHQRADDLLLEVLETIPEYVPIAKRFRNEALNFFYA